MSPEQVRKWLVKHLDELEPQGQGLTLSRLKHLHIDHFVPKCKHGPDHPMNFVLMQPSMNQHFGGAFSLEKCQYVGWMQALAIVELNIRKLSGQAADSSVLEYCLSRLAKDGWAVPQSAAIPVNRTFCVSSSSVYCRLLLTQGAKQHNLSSRCLTLVLFSGHIGKTKLVAPEEAVAAVALPRGAATCPVSKPHLKVAFMLTWLPALSVFQCCSCANGVSFRAGRCHQYLAESLIVQFSLCPLQ
jgi:hypothetical protein